MKASEFFREHVSSEERRRLESLELYDEHEPWHLKCTHYTLLAASNGKQCTTLVDKLYASSTTNARSLLSHGKLTPALRLKPLGVKFGTRFGHTMCAVNGKLVVVGGFGELANDSSGKHARLPHIEVLDLNTMQLLVIDPTVKRISRRVRAFI